LKPTRLTEAELRQRSYRWRSLLVLVLVGAGAMGLVARAVELQLVQHGDLARRGDQASMRIVKMTAHRGVITDRNGEPLAMSTGSTRRNSATTSTSCRASRRLSARIRRR